MSRYNLGQPISYLAKVEASDKYYHDQHTETECSHLADELTCYFKTGTRSWVPGIISESVGERSNMIDGMDGGVYCRNRKDTVVAVEGGKHVEESGSWRTSVRKKQRA